MPDPLVVSPLDGQAYNRWSYVHNRPLVATDPTGYTGSFGSSDDDVRALPRLCDSETHCYRPIVVPDPNSPSSALDSWNRAVAMFDAYNGIGQGGPSHNPHTAGDTRRRDDSGQPGGTSEFTIRVTPDMCAEIAACSGSVTKRGPVYIWDAPIDDWARTAADIGTDFIPVVSTLKTVYAAVQRLDNGESAFDVLMSSGAEGLLSLIPGGKAGKRLGDAVDAVGDVADAAGDVQKAARTAGGPRAGKPFTRKGKAEIDTANAQRNGGVNLCENCGTQVVPGQRSQRGVRPPGNERQRDHIIPKSKGGDGSPSNGQVLCRDCNLDKSDKL
ncbi:HNH endonuclease [Paraliomyxa miuraensis]|uniref:HNH endonuclease n=1 Tax=Paraliomyxa miuraensis TaxID=376150 RepID=UPI002251B070|nr:HNH endonuclease signature motif containing protein [Paraliomyxa miuraensis]MCX4245982.1 HNH endonuclease [Paraliomyxa miuraensis]